MTDSNLRARRARLEPLLESARGLANGRSERGKAARARLAASSGLSKEGLDFALSRCLESQPSERELSALLESTPMARRAHVLLSANVFVAAHRAIAIALAAAPEVHVRASRREPEMAELLLEGAPGAFQIETELSPIPGDHVWVYGTDATLREIAKSLPPGVALHAHGSGFAIAVIHGRVSSAELGELLPRLAEDIALFDQRGCLSPRVLLVNGDPAFAKDVARALGRELTALEARLPRGRLDPAEAAEISSYRDTMTYAGEVFPAGLGFVSCAQDPGWVLPPIGRNLHVLPTSDVAEVLSSVAPMITSCAFTGDTAVEPALRRSLPGARLCRFGELQTPPFDGPVDLRRRAL